MRMKIAVRSLRWKEGSRNLNLYNVDGKVSNFEKKSTTASEERGEKNTWLVVIGF